VSVRCDTPISVGDGVELTVCVDSEIKHVIATLNIDMRQVGNKLKFLEELRDFIKSQCGEEFNIVNTGSEPRLVHVISISSEDVDKTIIDVALNFIKEKLNNCNVTSKISELLSKYKTTGRKSKTTRRKSS